MDMGTKYREIKTCNKNWAMDIGTKYSEMDIGTEH